MLFLKISGDWSCLIKRRAMSIKQFYPRKEIELALKINPNYAIEFEA